MTKYYDKSGTLNPNFANSGWRVCRGCGSSYHSYDKGRQFCSQTCSHAESAEWGMKNGRRGYDAERALFIKFVDAGCLPFRSAASKGPYDLIVVTNEGLTLLIQVKRTKTHATRWHAKTVRELMTTTPTGSGGEHVSWRKQVWCWVDRDKWYVTDWSLKDAPERYEFKDPIEWIYSRGFARPEVKGQGMLDVTVALLQ